MIRRRTALGDDLQPRAARPGKSRRIWVLVDSDFLNRRRRNSRPVCLNPVHDQRDAIRPDGAVIQKARKHADVIPIKHRHAIQRRSVQVIRILIFGHIRGHHE